MRIRPWCLDGAGRAFRQTVLLSSFSFPEANALLGRHCGNWAGRAVLRVRHEVHTCPSGPSLCNIASVETSASRYDCRTLTTRITKDSENTGFPNTYL